MENKNKIKELEKNNKELKDKNNELKNINEQILKDKTKLEENIKIKDKENND